jgi:hypothetical protein
MRHHIAPQIGRRRISVLEDNGATRALVDVGHPFAFHFGELLFPEFFD